MESHPCCFLMLDIKDEFFHILAKMKAEKTGKEAKKKGRREKWKTEGSKKMEFVEGEREWWIPGYP